MVTYVEIWTATNGLCETFKGKVEYNINDDFFTIKDVDNDKMIGIPAYELESFSIYKIAEEKSMGYAAIFQAKLRQKQRG